MHNTIQERIEAALRNPVDAASTLDEKLARAAESVGRIEETVHEEFGSQQHAEESPHLQAEVSPNTAKWADAATWEAPSDGVVTRLVVWHVPNSEDALKTRPVILGTDNERRPLAPFPDGTEQFITGEPNDRPYEVAEPIREGEQVVIEAANSNSNYAYRFAVVPTVDYSTTEVGGAV